MDGVLAGRPAGDVADADHDDRQGKRKRHDADDHRPCVALVPMTDDNLVDDRRRIAADSRSARAGLRQVDGLFCGVERPGHGAGMKGQRLASR